MRARWKALALTAVLGLFGTDCLGPVVPIPPPGVERFASTLCPAQLCNGGGVLLRVRGTGRLGSLVVVENLTTRLPGEGRYASSGFANADPTIPSDPDAGAGTVGRYEVTLGPVLTDDGSVVAVSRPGDRFVVYQYTRTETGELRISQTSSEMVVPEP